jgi:hypothetical protein
MRFHVLVHDEPMAGTPGSHAARMPCSRRAEGVPIPGAETTLHRYEVETIW